MRARRKAGHAAVWALGMKEHGFPGGVLVNKGPKKLLLILFVYGVSTDVTKANSYNYRKLYLRVTYAKQAVFVKPPNTIAKAPGCRPAMDGKMKLEVDVVRSSC